MTREEIKNKNASYVVNMFGSRNKNGDIFYYYPMLVNNEEKQRYEIQELFVQTTKYSYLMQYPDRFSIYIDNLFNKYNIVEILTDADDTMMPFGNSYIPDMKKLREKYTNKDIVINGYCGFMFGEADDYQPAEYIIP